MRIRIGLMSALAMALAASGCGGHTQGAGPTPPRAAHLTSRPWTLLATREGDRLVVIRYRQGDCWGAAQARTTERPRSVTIELLQPYTGAAGLCPHFLLGRDLQVHLQAPLGQRRLLHAWVGAGPG